MKKEIKKFPKFVNFFDSLLAVVLLLRWWWRHQSIIFIFYLKFFYSFYIRLFPENILFPNMEMLQFDIFIKLIGNFRKFRLPTLTRCLLLAWRHCLSSGNPLKLQKGNFVVVVVDCWAQWRHSYLIWLWSISKRWRLNFNRTTQLVVIATASCSCSFFFFYKLFQLVEITSIFSLVVIATILEAFLLLVLFCRFLFIEKWVLNRDKKIRRQIVLNVLNH